MKEFSIVPLEDLEAPNFFWSLGYDLGGAAHVACSVLPAVAAGMAIFC